MNFFRYCDFFNINFHFYYENKDAISIFGGFMSIFYVTISIIITILLSIDDFRKLNPVTTKSEVPGGEFRLINIKDSKIYIPWRLITYEEKFIDHRGILYPSITLIEGKLEDFGMDLKYYNLKYTLCNETSMINITDQYKIDTPLDKLFCIEQNDIPFGGSWLGDSLYYLEVNLFLCEDGIKFNASDDRCTILEDIVKYTNTTWLFEFYYPIVQFQPTNHDIPMVVIYKNYYYRLSSHTYKLERLYIQENILSDDKSLFLTSPKNTSYWGISTIYGDTYFWSKEQDPLVKSNSSVLFSLDIYMDQGHIFYTRSYKKIFDIFSNVFPLLNISLIIFEKFTVWVKSAFAKQSIADIVFENSTIFKKKNKLFFNFDNKMRKNLRNTIFSNKRPKIEDTVKIYKEKPNINKLDYLNNEKENHSVKKGEINKLMRKKTEFSKDESLLKLHNNSINITKINKNRRKTEVLVHHNSVENRFDDSKDYIIRKRKGKLFPFFYFFMDAFIQKLDRPKSFCCLDKKYLIVYHFMEKIFNISSYILLFKNFSIYKTIFSKEMRGLNFHKLDKKININNNELMHNIEQKVFTSDSEYNEIFSRSIVYYQ